MLTVVTEAPPAGRARVVLSKVLRKVDAEVNFAVLGDTLPPDGVVVAMTDYDNRVFTQLVTAERRIPITKARGYRFEGDSGPVIPTFSASLVAAGKMNLIPVLIWDLTRALDEQDHAAPTWPLDELELYPTPESFRRWCDEAASSSSFVVHDIETEFSNQFDADDDEQDSSYEITRFSLARSDGHAITAPYREPFVCILKEFLAASRIDRVGWNSDEFDDPREAYNEWPMLGRRVDARWLWHFLQPTLPQSLACVSTFYTRVPEWKSIGSSTGTDDELYSAMDAWATAQNYLGIMKALKNRRLQ